MFRSLPAAATLRGLGPLLRFAAGGPVLNVMRIDKACVVTTGKRTSFVPGHKDLPSATAVIRINNYLRNTLLAFNLNDSWSAFVQSNCGQLPAPHAPRVETHQFG